MTKKVVLTLFLLILCMGFILAVVNFFALQSPSDLDAFNVLGTSLNISYNISDINLVFSTIKIYYKTNSSTSDTNFFFTNGTLTSGFQSRNYSSNTSAVFLFRLFHDQVYPAVYNYNETIMQAATHSSYNLSDNDVYIKIRFFNISNQKNFSFFEIYANNQTAASLSLRMYYCNSSYSGNASPLTSPLCTNFYNMPASEPFNHSHQVSRHHVIPFPINVTSGTIGTVRVTPISYFLLRGRTSITNAWDVYYIQNISRTDTIQVDSNGGVGVAWNNFAGTVDAHFHQYDGTDTLVYYTCANDSLGNQNCTALKPDLIGTGGLNPSSPNIFSPINQSYRGNIIINYTGASSPNGYAIRYNITLVNSSDDFVSVVTANNSANLSYIWDSTGTADGIYNFHVLACDSNNLCSVGESDDFTLDNTNPSASLDCVPSSINPGGIISCTCTSSDNVAVASTVFTQYPSTVESGTFSTTCNATDSAGNSAISSFAYSVLGGASGGGGSSCTTKWACGEWGTCYGNIQTRTCSYPNNYCTPELAKPAIIQNCTSPVAENWNTNQEIQDGNQIINEGEKINGAIENKNTETNNFMFFIAGIGFSIIILVVSVWRIRKAKKSKLGFFRKLFKISSRKAR